MDTGLRRLRYFEALHDELNFHRAASRLNITQSTLSRAIAQLERDVGTKLFERSNKRVRVTRAGEAFAVGCARVLMQLDATLDRTHKVARGYAGSLRIGYTDTIIAGCLPDLIKSFNGIAPDVHLRLIQGYTEEQVTMLEGGLLDIGLLTGPLSRPGFETRVVQADRLLAIMPRDHPLAGEADVALAGLARSPFVMGDPDRWGAFNAHFQNLCDRAHVRPEVIQTAPESRAILGLVACGLGLTVMPESFAATLDARLAALPIRGMEEPMTTLAVWRRAAAHPALIRFVEHMEAATAVR